MCQVLIGTFLFFVDVRHFFLFSDNSVCISDIDLFYFSINESCYECLSGCCPHCIQQRHVAAHPVHIRVPFPVLLWCFRSAQYLDGILHPGYGEEPICIPLYRFGQLPVLLPVQYLRHVVRAVYRPAHPPVLHPQRYHCTVLAFLHPHPFVHDSFRRCRYLYPTLLPGDQALPVVVQVSIQLQGLLINYP